MAASFTNRQKADCAQREVTQRVRVYKRLVENKKMSERTATAEIEKMQEIASEYAALADAEEAKGRLL